MATANRHSSCWPTAEQTLLLRAIFSEGEAGARALAGWRERVQLDSLDRVSIRLLPFLAARATDDELTARVDAVREQVGTRNRELIEGVTGAVTLLRAAGIDSVVLKGLAVVARGYAPVDQRGMADGDLLVPVRQVLAARDRLLDAGWQLAGRIDAALLDVRHATLIRSADGRPVDLHWHVLAECCGPDDDASFWSHAQPATLGTTAVSTLSPTDMLLHACVHGLNWSLSSPIRWIADALLILKHAPIEWTRLTHEAETRALVLPLRHALAYLASTFDAPIPEAVHAALAAAPLPSWADAEYRVKLERRSTGRQIRMHWLRHRRLRGSGTLMGDLLTAPVYIQRRWAFGLRRDNRRPA